MASKPIHLQKKRMCHIFQLLMQPFSCCCWHYNHALSVWLFMIGQLLIARPVIAIVRKSHHFSSWAWIGRTADNCEVDCAWFQLTVYQTSRKKLQQKSKRMRKRWCQWGTMVRRPGMFCSALQCGFHHFEKVPNFLLCQALSCLTLEIEVQYMFTLICMQCLCFRNPPN